MKPTQRFIWSVYFLSASLLLLAIVLVRNYLTEPTPRQLTFQRADGVAEVVVEHIRKHKDIPPTDNRLSTVLKNNGLNDLPVDVDGYFIAPDGERFTVHVSTSTVTVKAARADVEVSKSITKKGGMFILLLCGVLFLIGFGYILGGVRRRRYFSQPFSFMHCFFASAVLNDRSGEEWIAHGIFCWVVSLGLACLQFGT